MYIIEYLNNGPAYKCKNLHDMLTFCNKSW